MIAPECHLWGEAFSPSRLKEAIPNVQMRSVTEPGEIHEHGRYQGKPTPHGACCSSTPEEIEVSQRIEWMADFIAMHFDTFKAAGASNVVYQLYWTGLQGNMEFTPRELKKIASLEVPFCIDYIQESED